MRAPNFLLISLLAGMPLCLPAHAISFQTRLEKVEWTVEGDQFEERFAVGMGRQKRHFGFNSKMAQFGRLATWLRWLPCSSRTIW